MRQQQQHCGRSGIMVSLRFSGFPARSGGSAVIYMTGGCGGAIIFFDCCAAGSHYVYMDLRLRWVCIIQPERPGFRDFWNSVVVSAAVGHPRTRFLIIFSTLMHKSFASEGFFCCFFFFVTVKCIVRCCHRLSVGIQTEDVTLPPCGSCRRRRECEHFVFFFSILQQFHHQLLFSLVPSVTVAVDHESAARHSRRFPSSPNASRQPH